MKNDPQVLIRNKAQFFRFLDNTRNLTNLLIQEIDFSQDKIDWQQLKFENTVFLGCTFLKEDAFYVISSGAYVYPKFKDIPYNPYRVDLYTWQELMEGSEFNFEESEDYSIYQHFSANKYNPPVNEAMAQRIHDHSIDDAIRELLGYKDDGTAEKKVVGIMGGHSVSRKNHFYREVAYTAKWLTEKGYYIASGGGPGIMEAANLGAYFGGKSDDELAKAIKILCDLKIDSPKTKEFLSPNYLEKSYEVLSLFSDPTENLAIPTWFYGHEPTSVFATHIAKYFSNSIREDILLAISIYGVVFAPGSAGTTQEIFQEAAQNHYGSFGQCSPMVFLSKERYVEETSIYSLIHQLAKGKEYKKLLYLTDKAKEVVDYIVKHPPINI